ncbi:N-acetylglucosamine-6-phosphate deacetylase [Granulicella sp. 5B5]|uniref:N-acetylglucosamine-6-phosphate deacetylase n=1 Tax=Granulicella sp. 5B5 TaxID=1617967 RepID=UPI0015F36B01|nr:N-acetylglucosamine-6-phosphate deacetylase [Granulicella sp. 5B5]QMV17983.1 N-acetylglucosamine-6-phosphate deacetylase [Granulicella sp. 5B5]
MNVSTITARRLLTATGIVDFPVLRIAADGTLLELTSDPAALAHETDTLTASFLDVHTHGAVGHDVMHVDPAGLSRMQRFLASHGVASYLPTTVTASVDSTLRALEALANAVESTPAPGEAQPIGIHLEGPFLSHIKRGTHPPAELQQPSIELFDRFQQAARGHILLMTIAPELVSEEAPANSALKGTGFSPSGGSRGLQAPEKGAGSPGLQPRVSTEGTTALDLIRHAASKGVRATLGHSNATDAEARCGIAAGATSATHIFNAMRALDHREPGIVGAILDDDSLFAEIICDGIHVAPELIRLWLKIKGPHRGILVTDAMSATGIGDGSYSLGDFDVTVTDGRALLSGDLAQGKETLAGSLLTLDVAVANLQHFAHADLGAATRLASHNPAAMLGRPSHTAFTIGAPISLNRFNAANQLITTIVRGISISG